MPHLRIRSLDSDQVAKLSTSLVAELAEITGAPADNFTLELVQTQFFQGGEVVASFPFVEVLWFQRPQAMQDACAVLITKRVKDVVPEQDVVVVFTELAKDGYYENGKHF